MYGKALERDWMASLTLSIQIVLISNRYKNSHFRDVSLTICTLPHFYTFSLFTKKLFLQNGLFISLQKVGHVTTCCKWPIGSLSCKDHSSWTTLKIISEQNTRTNKEQKQNCSKKTRLRSPLPACMA